MERAEGLEARGRCWLQRDYTIYSFFRSFFLVLSVSLLSFICQRGRRVAGGELRHLAGSPGGGGDIRGLSYSN
jgi:hypothetical protein